MFYACKQLSSICLHAGIGLVCIHFSQFTVIMAHMNMSLFHVCVLGLNLCQPIKYSLASSLHYSHKTHNSVRLIWIKHCILYSRLTGTCQKFLLELQRDTESTLSIFTPYLYSITFTKWLWVLVLPMIYVWPLVLLYYVIQWDPSIKIEIIRNNFMLCYF